jgi:hypothetical protein
MLQPGMTVAQVQQVMGDKGIASRLPSDASYRDAIRFEKPPRYPNLRIRVAFSAWGESEGTVAWWMFIPDERNSK